ncbi:MAG: hypothetical protein V7K98_04495 [Nostoc sp.]|uniref:hypothetical protein n=1 Tax=Nostoc sp. TaxID=1180 RepID=UPI002FFCED0A
MSDINLSQAQELSIEELDVVAGGARRFATAHTQELNDFQESTLVADRDGVRSHNTQETDYFKASTFEATDTGK